MKYTIKSITEPTKNDTADPAHVGVDLDNLPTIAVNLTLTQIFELNCILSDRIDEIQKIVNNSKNVGVVEEFWENELDKANVIYKQFYTAGSKSYEAYVNEN